MGSAVGAMKSRPAVKTAAAIMTAAGALVAKDTRKAVVEQMTPRSNNTHRNNQAPHIAACNDKESEGETIGLACIFEQGTITDAGCGNEGSNNATDSEEAAMDNAGSGVGNATGRSSWSEMEPGMRFADGYEVRYEYSEKQSEKPRSVPTELYTLALELWRADPDLEFFSFNKD
jgi:hypothetical protein